MALSSETRGIMLAESLLKTFYLSLKFLDVLEILIVLSDLRTQLVVNLAFLIINDV